MLTRLLRLLAPLTPRRHPRLFPIFRRGRSQTGLFRSRRLRPTPSPRPRTQPLQRRPAAPSQPQPSSPTRQKKPAQAISRQPAPSGGRLARDSSPFTPTQFPPPGTRPRPRPIPATAGCRAGASRPASRPGLATTPWQDLAHPRPAALPCHTPVRPSPGVARRVPASAQKTPRRASRVFWKKLLLRARPPLSPLGTAPLSSPSKHPTAPAPSTLAGIDKPSEPV